jgi:hypothetical protein
MKITSGVRSVSVQNTPMIDRYGVSLRYRYGAVKAPRVPPTPAIAIMIPIPPGDTPLLRAITIMIIK